MCGGQECVCHGKVCVCGQVSRRWMGCKDRQNESKVSVEMPPESPLDIILKKLESWVDEHGEFVGELLARIKTLHKRIDKLERHLVDSKLEIMEIKTRLGDSQSLTDCQ